MSRTPSPAEDILIKLTAQRILPTVLVNGHWFEVPVRGGRPRLMRSTGGHLLLQVQEPGATPMRSGPVILVPVEAISAVQVDLEENPGLLKDL